MLLALSLPHHTNRAPTLKVGVVEIVLLHLSSCRLLWRFDCFRLLVISSFVQHQATICVLIVLDDLLVSFSSCKHFFLVGLVKALHPLILVTRLLFFCSWLIRSFRFQPKPCLSKPCMFHFSHRVPLVFPHAAVLSTRTVIFEDHLREPSALDPLQRHWKVLDLRSEKSLPRIIVLPDEVLNPILHFSLPSVGLLGPKVHLIANWGYAPTRWLWTLGLVHDL